jgi:OOP family OmpA-OmpF porin
LEIGLGAPENWLQIATSAINNLNFLKTGDADMTDSHLKLTGKALDTAANTTIANNFNQLSTLFSVDLEVANPPIPVANTSVAEQAPEHSCLDQFKQSLSNDRIIYFSTDSSQLKEQSERAINKILQFSSACPNSIIEVAGYTDSRGSEPYNLTLSNKRAKSIANELIKRGVPTKMLTVKGYGESNPSSNNDTGKGQANNRRIEFRYLQEGE